MLIIKSNRKMAQMILNPHQILFVYMFGHLKQKCF